MVRSYVGRTRPVIGWRLCEGGHGCITRQLLISASVTGACDTAPAFILNVDRELLLRYEDSRDAMMASGQK